jgi:CRISPR system Cascade subunit CasA
MIHGPKIRSISIMISTTTKWRMHSMNLTGDPWIPVVFGSGESRLVSLDEAFQRGDEISDLVANPPQRIALTRMLVCITQAALDGPQDEDDWQGCRGRIIPAALDYLQRHRACFELFGEGAFLQVPNLEENPKPLLDKLDFGTASNASTLYDHAAVPEGRLRSPAWSALMLLTFQCFSPGGTIGIARWNGKWTSSTGKDKGPDSSENAPCLSGSPLHIILRGKDLIATIHMNLLSKALIRSLPNATWGHPCWESMPQGAGDPAVEDLSRSYLGRLVPLARAIKLRPGRRRITLANGMRYPKISEYREPGAIVIMPRSEKKTEPMYLRLDPNKHPWRELCSILALDTNRAGGGALVLHHLTRLERADTFDLWAGGLAANKAKLEDTAEWELSLPMKMIWSAALKKYENGVMLAKRGQRCLGNAISEYFKDLKLTAFTRSDTSSRAQRSRVIAKAGIWYWHALDARYIVLVEAAADPTRHLGDEWYEIVYSAMNRAYENACAHTNPRQLRAFAKGSQQLRLRRPERSSNEEAEAD